MKTNKINWSNLQNDVFNFVTSCNESLVVSAVAGSGKTTTIIEAARRLPKDNKILFLSFNKSICDENKTKLANFPNVKVKTLHQQGFETFKRLGMKLDNSCYRKMIGETIYNYSSYINIDSDENVIHQYTNNILHLYNLCRVNLLTFADIKQIENLAYKYAIDVLDDEIKVTAQYLKNAYKKEKGDTFDFTDMLTLACQPFYSRFLEKFDVVFVDECQDLNAAQRKLVSLSLKPNGKFIAVGDEYQAINGFAGADSESFTKLVELANGNKLPLSVNYRCGKKIIEKVTNFAPEIGIKADKNAIDGNVENITDLKNVAYGDMIISRTTAPLISVCLKLIAAHKNAFVKGRDIMENLLKLIEKHEGKSKNTATLLNNLDKEKAKLIAKLEKKGVKNPDTHTSVLALIDKIECIKVLAEGFVKIADMKKTLNEIFQDYNNSKNSVCLLTAHKSKGLETDNVFIIDTEKFPLKWKNQLEWQYQQEINLMYVAYTRAKKNLYFVNTDYHTVEVK